jgi:hypothetical protein
LTRTKEVTTTGISVKEKERNITAIMLTLHNFKLNVTGSQIFGAI